MEVPSPAASPKAGDARAFRLLPHEHVLWTGRPLAAPGEPAWLLWPLLLGAMALVFGLFGSLQAATQMPGARPSAALAVLLGAMALAGRILPRWLLDECRYLVTDQRVLWRRGRFLRSVERSRLTHARVRWHHASPLVGDLEVVAGVPFGPLMRKQRIVLHGIREPDRVLAIVRGATPSALVGDRDAPLAERLDAGETLRWHGRPEGLLLGWRELATAGLGAVVTFVGAGVGQRTAQVLLNLEGLGLSPRSTEWMLLFGAVAISWICIVAVGLRLLHHGIFRARRLGRDTEYLLTERRLLVRRGLVELSVERAHVVDVALRPAGRGLHHLFLVLDTPRSRALADSGALAPVLPARDRVPPVLFELRDAGAVRDALLR
ncbi:MAG: hypothetical protein AAGH15_07340 [Myxococcota bacterium]